MLIDFHTHAFVDKIAERAIAKLEDVAINSGYPDAGKAFNNGTISALRNTLKESGVDKGVLLPIATKPSQQTTINNWARSVMDDTIISFGSVHPDADDWSEQLENINAMGLKGIKLHPDYQNFFANEDKLIPIYKKCAELGLPVILHAGVDALSMNLVHCTPQMCADILKKVPSLTLIAAHLGGNLCWDDVEKYLVGKNIYLDTAFIAGYVSKEQFKRIVANHSADKILFASDCPWHLPSMEKDFINSIDISEDEKQKIFYKNACKLLGL